MIDIENFFDGILFEFKIYINYNVYNVVIIEEN